MYNVIRGKSRNYLKHEGRAMYRQLKRMREANGWSRESVAQRVGVNVPMLCMIETGKRDPSYKVLVALEDVFHTSHRVLLREE